MSDHRIEWRPPLEAGAALDERIAKLNEALDESRDGLTFGMFEHIAALSADIRRWKAAAMDPEQEMGNRGEP